MGQPVRAIFRTTNSSFFWKTWKYGEPLDVTETLNAKLVRYLFCFLENITDILLHSGALPN